MSKYVIDGTTLSNIADAIRAGSGSTEAMTPAEMAAAIAGMGGTGGLPNGISALAAGTFTPTTDVNEVQIEHGLGVVPSFIVAVLETDVSAEGNDLYQTVYNIFLTKRVFNSSNAKVAVSVGLLGVIRDGYYCRETIWRTLPYDAATITMLSPYNDAPLRAGNTYSWVCGVIDGIN